MALNKFAILGSQDRPSKSVDVPEWGGTVNIATMSGAERDAFESDVCGGDGKVRTQNIRAKLLVRCIVDDAGGRVFTDADADELGTKSAAALDRLFDVARKLNGLSKQDVEELAKN
jgi:hypothetical protein